VRRLLLVALAVSVAAPVVAQAPDRWFALAWEKGERRQMGPFGTLDACESARMERAQRDLDDIYARAPKPYGPRPLPQDQAALARYDAEARRLQNNHVMYWLSEITRLQSEVAFWRDKAICQRF
jgi:hypothetical protein